MAELTREVAQAKIKQDTIFVDELEDAYVFLLKGIDENSDMGGRIWVLKETGQVCHNPFEYIKISSKLKKK